MLSQEEMGLEPRIHAIQKVRENWGWFLTLGILLIVLGIIAVSSAYLTTLFTVFLLGMILFAGGVIQTIQAFLARQWSGLFLSLLLGILYLVTGFLAITRPTEMAMGLTLLIASLCLVGGLFKMGSSIALRFNHWGWVFFNGLITFILGLMIWSQWPVSGLWVIGLFVGIDLILTGWSWVMISTMIRPRVS